MCSECSERVSQLSKWKSNGRFFQNVFCEKCVCAFAPVGYRSLPSLLVELLRTHWIGLRVSTHSRALVLNTPRMGLLNTLLGASLGWALVLRYSLFTLLADVSPIRTARAGHRFFLTLRRFAVYLQSDRSAVLVGLCRRRKLKFIGFDVFRPCCKQCC